MARGVLAGVRVCLSAALTEDMRPAPSVDAAEVVRQLALAVFREGGQLVHGSHPSIVPILQMAAEDTFPGSGEASRLTLVRAAKFCTPEYRAEIEAHRRFARIEMTRDPEAHADEPERAVIRDLVEMRDWMADRCDVVVALGGRWFESDRPRAGIPIEIDTFLDRGKPAFVITACGGAAAGYVENDPALLGRLHNGLDADANRALDAELLDARRHPLGLADVAERIVKQISLLPLASRRVEVRPMSPAQGAAAAPTGRPPAGEPGRDTFRILCLDGGGIRGAFTAAVLATWAKMLPSTGTEMRFVDRFDLVAGTSTGSILAVGLAMGLEPGEMVELYLEHAESIFPSTWGRAIFSRKYSTEPLRVALEKLLSGKTLNEARRPLAIPAVEALRGQAVLFTTPHCPDRTGHRDLKAVEAVLASAAAPTFFSEADVSGPIATARYLDGGIWANNPVLPAVIEAIGHLGASPDRIDVLSVGTMTTEYDFSKAHGGGKAQWGPRIADLFFAAQETAAEELVKRWLKVSRFLRINDFTSDLANLDDAKVVDGLVERGQALGEKTFPDVRGRFLDGPPAPKWPRY